MVSSTNVEAVAANNVALQHYGQNVVYGHVTTNSGRRVLIQITFDVMSVRKPLLSTSAMKRRWVTIIFNHDYDRIIFQNETANWISHDCHAYLCLTLANRIPHRKAMVMVGENVSTKKSTLVMVTWDMKHTASAGERRAIADADQAGQHDISGETRAAKALRTPEPPTDAAQEVKLLRRQLEELNARMEEIRQQSASAAMDAAVTGLTDAVTTMGQSVTRPRPWGHESREARAVHAWQRLRRLGLHVQRICWYARSCVSGPAESSETVNDSGSHKGAHETTVRFVKRGNAPKWRA